MSVTESRTGTSMGRRRTPEERAAREKQLRARRRAPGRRRRIIAGAAALVVLAFVAVLLFTPLFGVRHIEVHGASSVAAGEIRKASAIGNGEPLARLDTAAAAANVQKLPAVESATVSRRWPAGVLITVTERTPVAVVERDGQQWVIDKHAIVYLPLSAEPRGQGIPTLKVSSPGPGDGSTVAATQVLGVLPPKLRQLIATVTADSPAQVTFTLTDGRTVLWGAAERNDEKASILPSVLAHKGSVYDVSSPDHIVIQ